MLHHNVLSAAVIVRTALHYCACAYSGTTLEVLEVNLHAVIPDIGSQQLYAA